jgi:threonine dehydratase
VIHPRAVTEFIYRYNVSGDRAHVLLSFKVDSLSRSAEVKEVLAALEASDMKGYDISDDEMAKSHARYMIGGCQQVPHERVFRFGKFDRILILGLWLILTPEFPERPGALRAFLLGLQQGWNISLFHYRNHGAGSFSLRNEPSFDVLKSLEDLGKVLAGIQVPPADYDAFDAYLKKLNYSYVEETDNLVYKRYLRG